MTHKLHAPQKLFIAVFTSELFTCSVVDHMGLEIMSVTVLVQASCYFTMPPLFRMGLQVFFEITSMCKTLVTLWVGAVICAQGRMHRQVSNELATEGKAFTTDITSMVCLFVQIQVLLVTSELSEGFVIVLAFELSMFVHEVFVQLCNGFA